MLSSIFHRLNGEDFDARYEARMDLQDLVSQATAPGNEEQQPVIENQLLEKLPAEPLLQTKLWIIRQLETIGSEQSLPALERLLKSESVELAYAAQMAIDRIKPTPAKKRKSPPRSALVKSVTQSDNRSTKTEAFRMLAEQSPRKAAKLMVRQPEIDFLPIALKSGNKVLIRPAIELLDTGSVEQQIVILGALPNDLGADSEGIILELLKSENETLAAQAAETLGRVGSSASLERLAQLVAGKSRALRDAASEAVAQIEDSKIDEILFDRLQSGTIEEKETALSLLALRASDGVSEVVNKLAASEEEPSKLREAAIESLEMVGNVESLSILVDIVVDGNDKGLRRDAQKNLKRLTLLLSDHEAAWRAFESGFEKAEGKDELLALLIVSDSAPTPQMIEYLELVWNERDADLRKMVMRVLPGWRNWDAGYALLKIAEAEEAYRGECFAGIGKLILGSDANFSMQGKFELSQAALKLAQSPEEKEAVLTGFRYATWREANYVFSNEVLPELREAVLKYRNN
ncbi:HEAT repeat domain-containing protein [Pelagicoccus albus]|uniref:HEAT repeat domain-containing protein n=1 Tax=Pelagicoccus albus TaxID=415222 RepID=A0A7X1E9U3_9BACT|nr:HEAT repeat domain-containing protein [Pelagicoccus albus]